MSKVLTSGLAVLALVTGAAARADGDAESASPLRESPRALNGHVFQPSRLVLAPFTATSFGMATLFGVGQADAPRYDLQGNQIGTRNVSMATYGQALELDLRAMPDVALRFQLNGLLFAGTNGRSLLVAGGTAQYGLVAGLVAGKDLGKKARLSFVFDASLEPQLSVTIANAVLRAIQTRTFEEGALFSNVERVRTAPGLSFAWAPSPWLGFLAEARYAWTRRVTSDDTRLTAQGVTLGAGAEVDLDPLVRWPIAVQASYRSELPVEGGPNVQQAGVGVFYTRRVHLALGVDVVWRHGEIRPGIQPQLQSDSAVAAIRLQYYW